MVKALPKLAALSLCLWSLAGCVSRGEPGPAFPEQYPPSEATTGGSQAAKPTGAWNSFVSTMTDNPVSNSVKSAGKKTVDTLTPKPHVTHAEDPISLGVGANKPNAAMFVSMAEVQLSANNLEGASQAYEKALQLDKNHVPAIIGLAHTRFRQQRHEEAHQLFTRARKLDPNNLHAMLGQAHYHDTRENMPEATRLYSEATERHPGNAAAWNDLGLCLARQRRLPESQQTLLRAVQLEQTNVLYRNNLATVLVELGRNEEALLHLQQAHGPAAGHYNLGYLLHRRGASQAAAEQFELALRADPSFEGARQWLDKINGEQDATRRAGRPAMGRSAAIFRGPTGKGAPLFAHDEAPALELSTAHVSDTPAAPVDESIVNRQPLVIFVSDDSPLSSGTAPLVVHSDISQPEVAVVACDNSPEIVTVSAESNDFDYDNEDATLAEAAPIVETGLFAGRSLRICEAFEPERPRTAPRKNSAVPSSRAGIPEVNQAIAIVDSSLFTEDSKTLFTRPTSAVGNGSGAASLLQPADEGSLRLQAPPAEEVADSEIAAETSSETPAWQAHGWRKLAPRYAQ